MWCKHCRQDVKGVRSPDQSGSQLRRCGDLVFADEATAHGRGSGVATIAATWHRSGRVPPLRTESTFEDWELDERYRRVQARVGRWKHHDAQRRPQRPRRAAQPTWHVASSDIRVRRRKRQRGRRGRIEASALARPS